jgi:hypothetical protein
MNDSLAVKGSEYGRVHNWCALHPNGKVILGVDTLADAAVVASAVPRTWRGTARVVMTDEEHGGIKSGFSKTIAVARMRFAFSRHLCSWRLIR